MRFFALSTVILLLFTLQGASAQPELLFVPETPVAVTIDEAIELAKDYGGEESGRFVNGVLDAVRRRLDAASAPAAVDTQPEGYESTS